MYLKRIQKVKKIIFMEYEKTSRQKSCGRKNFFIILFILQTECPSGGIGRRVGLKIRLGE